MKMQKQGWEPYNDPALLQPESWEDWPANSEFLENTWFSENLPPLVLVPELPEMIRREIQFK